MTMADSPLDLTLGFLGAGNMAEAIARGILAAGVLPPGAILASDPSEERRRLFADDLGIEALDANDPVVDRADVVLLAVKPQVVDKALAPVGGGFGPEKLLLSICAGVSTAHLEGLTKAGTRVVRAMPNTPMLVGRGMAAVCPGALATDDDLAIAERLLGAAAEVVRVPEDLMDSVTAVSGSGPAYFFYLAELLAAAGVEVGLPPETAERLARVTFEGAAKLLGESGEPAADLRRKVTSPGGTTEAAVRTFDALGLGKLVTAAVTAARDRGRELGR
jgi:pyrroline-5-carboxylate reductase